MRTGNRARSTGRPRRSASLAKGHRESTAIAPVLDSPFLPSQVLSLRERCMREICTCSVRGGTSEGPDSQIDRHPFRPGATWIGRIARQGEIPASKQAAMSGQFPSCDNTQLKLLPCYRLRLQTRAPAFGGFKEFAPTSEIEWNAQAKSDRFCGREN